MIIHKHNTIKCWKFFSSSLFDDAGTIIYLNAGFSDMCLVLDWIMFEWLKFGTFGEFVLIFDLEIVKVLAFWNFDKHWNLSKKIKFQDVQFFLVGRTQIFHTSNWTNSEKPNFLSSKFFLPKNQVQTSPKARNSEISKSWTNSYSPKLPKLQPFE